MSFSSVSSDFVLLATTTASSSASISFDGYYSSTYRNYKIIIDSLSPSTSSYFYMRARQSNADVTSSIYIGGQYNQYPSWDTANYYQTSLNAGGGGTISNYNNNSPLSQWSIAYAREVAASDSSTLRLITNSGAAFHGEFTIYNPLGTTDYKIMSNFIVARTEGNQQNMSYGQTILIGSNQLNSTSALSGITFYPSTGNFARGTFKLYGIK